VFLSGSVAEASSNIVDIPSNQPSRLIYSAGQNQGKQKLMSNSKTPQKNGNRRPGRPPSGERKIINRDMIFKQGLRETKKKSLQDLSVVTMAEKMDVTPALIHYYIGGRDYLTSGIMNLFYRNIIREWPKKSGVWYNDLKSVCRCFFNNFNTYGGIASYATVNSRFRVFQLIMENEKDYGLLVLERFTGAVRESGLSWDRTGLYTNQIMDFLINISNSAARHMFPADHRRFLEERTNALDPEKYPNLIAARSTPLTLSADVAFELGLDLFLLGILSEIEGKTVSQRVDALIGGLSTLTPHD
jgi:hypothetical protein